MVIRNKQNNQRRYKFSGGSQLHATNFIFPPHLRTELIEYFQESYNMNISHEQANEWLDSLVNLFNCFKQE